MTLLPTSSCHLHIYKSFDDSHEVRSVFLEISKAFAKVWHKGLIFKLNQDGVSGNKENKEWC